MTKDGPGRDLENESSDRERGRPPKVLSPAWLESKQKARGRHEVCWAGGGRARRGISSFKSTFLSFFFQTAPRGLRDLSWPTRDGTKATSSGSAES